MEQPQRVRNSGVLIGIQGLVVRIATASQKVGTWINDAYCWDSLGFALGLRIGVFQLSGLYFIYIYVYIGAATHSAKQFREDD